MNCPNIKWWISDATPRKMDCLIARPLSVEETNASLIQTSGSLTSLVVSFSFINEIYPHTLTLIASSILLSVNESDLGLSPLFNNKAHFKVEQFLLPSFKHKKFDSKSSNSNCSKASSLYSPSFVYTLCLLPATSTSFSIWSIELDEVSPLYVIWLCLRLRGQ